MICQRAVLLVLSCFLLLISACRSNESPTATPLPPPTDTPEPVSEPVDLLDTLARDGRFQTLLSTIETADLVEKLSSEGPYTVFAATDQAFADLPEGALDDSERMFDILLYHVIDEMLTSADLAGLSSVVTLLGDEAPLAVDGNTIRISNVPIEEADIRATNGVIHVVNTVLIPPSIVHDRNDDEHRFSNLALATR